MSVKVNTNVYKIYVIKYKYSSTNYTKCKCKRRLHFRKCLQSLGVVQLYRSVIQCINKQWCSSVLKYISDQSLRRRKCELLFCLDEGSCSLTIIFSLNIDLFSKQSSIFTLYIRITFIRIRISVDCMIESVFPYVRSQGTVSRSFKDSMLRAEPVMMYGGDSWARRKAESGVYFVIYNNLQSLKSI